MLIGKDYPKIELEFVNLHLVEPITFIGDIMITAACVYAYVIVSKIKFKHGFFFFWRCFFILFGFSFFSGGFGHLLYNYWGLNGKYLSWYIGLFAVSMIELAMLAVHSNVAFSNRMKILSISKLILFFMLQTWVIFKVDLISDPSRGLIIPAINTFIGLILALGLLGVSYQKKYGYSFKYFWISIIVMFPNVFVQLFKINLFQWFDRNDISHVLLLTNVFIYLKGIQGASKLAIFESEEKKTKS